MNRAARPVAPADEAVIAAFVQDRFTDMFLSQNRRAQFGLLVAAALIAFVWFDHTQIGDALVWMGLVGTIALLRFAFTDRYVRAGGPQQATARIGHVLFVNGLLLATPLLAFDYFSEVGRAAMSIILLASATASVATTSGYRAVFLAFALPMLVPLALAWALAPHAEGSTSAAYGLAGLILLFLAFLVSVGRQAHQVFEEASRFRHGEQQLNRELTHALEQASEANRAKTQFLAAASHDLRQPIHSMNVLVAALGLRKLDDRSREIVNLLDTVNQTLSKQLDGLLDISKLDAGTVTASLSVHRLDHLLSLHHAAMAPVARERGLAFELHLDGPVSVLTDEALFTRALSNLTDNAFKFTRRGGTVRLALQLDGAEAVLSVTDNGIGIPADEQERVFREFYQVGNVERDRMKGLGLGLSIVQRLCGLLNVRLALTSNPGEGTVVTLRMRAVAPEQRADTPAAASTGIRPGLAVLVVDDEAQVRESMRLLLSELGCTVHLADGTEQARRIAAAHPLDAMLSDHRLRDGDSGLAAIRAVLAIHPATRMALITGDTAPDRMRDAQSAGVALLHKPVTLNTLLAVLRDG